MFGKTHVASGQTGLGVNDVRTQRPAARPRVCCEYAQQYATAQYATTPHKKVRASHRIVTARKHTGLAARMQHAQLPKPTRHSTQGKPYLKCVT